MIEIKPVAWKCGDDLYLTSSNRCDKCIPLYTADALAQAREEGRQAGLEEAAAYMEEDGDPLYADRIRALKER